jgi:PIN domain nuclease of toxin-antitoxin system
VRLLLDTHVLLWWLADDPSLGEEARTGISDPGSSVFVSAATVWEVSVKQALGKLEAPPTSCARSSSTVSSRRQ